MSNKNRVKVCRRYKELMVASTSYRKRIRYVPCTYVPTYKIRNIVRSSRLAHIRSYSLQMDTIQIGSEPIIFQKVTALNRTGSLLDVDGTACCTLPPNAFDETRMFLCKLNLVFILFAKMIPKDIVNFSFSSWYPTFKHLTFESKIIGLSDEAIAYLREDGILLPSGVDPHNSSRRPPADDTEGDDDISENEWPETEWSSSDEEDAVEPWVLDLKKVVDEAIRALGGDVFPKLNWSSPKDACWILPNRKLKCSSLSDILLLLKSSTFISYDLSVKIQEQKPVPLEMVLRQWSEINPGWFSCCPRTHRLID
jgi:D123